MPTLSPRAADILARMEPNIGYQPADLRRFAPELSAEGLRDVMRELWLAREVERFGYAGWRRARSSARLPADDDVVHTAEVTPVRPEDLFDHNSFAGLFK